MIQRHTAAAWLVHAAAGLVQRSSLSPAQAPQSTADAASPVLGLQLALAMTLLSTLSSPRCSHPEHSSQLLFSRHPRKWMPSGAALGGAAVLSTVSELPGTLPERATDMTELLNAAATQTHGFVS